MQGLPVDFAQNQRGSPCNFLYQIDFQVCSYNNGFYLKNILVKNDVKQSLVVVVAAAAVFVFVKTVILSLKTRVIQILTHLQNVLFTYKKMGAELRKWFGQMSL